MAGKRDSNYYAQRLIREYPAIYADLKAGRISSVRQAAIMAGLIREPTPIRLLERVWRKTPDSERLSFLLKYRAEIHAFLTTVRMKSIITPDRRLHDGAIQRINTIIGRRVIKPTDAMEEMGFKRLDTSLSRALRKEPVRPLLEKALLAWLAANRNR